MQKTKLGAAWSLTSTQLAVIAVHAVRRPGEDARKRGLSDPAAPQQHHPVRAAGLRRLLPAGRVGGDDRVRGRPAPAAAVRLPGGAGARLGAGDAGGDPGQQAVRQEVAARLADAPPVELRLQAEAVPPHAGQHH